MSIRELLNKYVIEMPPETPASTPATASSAPAPAPVSGIPGIPGIPGISGGFAPATPSYTATPIATGSDANLSANFAGKIQSAYSKSSTAPLVTQFLEALESLREFIPEEGNRFRAALKQVHATPPQLVDAFNSLGTVIDGEEAHFIEIIDSQRKGEIGTRESKVSEFTSDIEKHNVAIQGLMQQRDALSGEIVTMKTKLDTAQNSFDGAAKSLKAGLTDNINKINIYVPTATATK